jgi:hypothetical protein
MKITSATISCRRLLSRVSAYRAISRCPAEPFVGEYFPCPATALLPSIADTNIKGSRRAARDAGRAVHVACGVNDGGSLPSYTRSTMSWNAEMHVRKKYEDTRGTSRSRTSLSAAVASTQPNEVVSPTRGFLCRSSSREAIGRQHVYAASSPELRLGSDMAPPLGNVCTRSPEKSFSRLPERALQERNVRVNENMRLVGPQRPYSRG